jgi:small GTP-binding protein
MPANLPPQYHEAEKSYRLAKSAQEKIKALETMLAIMPKHKGTDKLRADLRRRMSKLSEELETKYAIGRKGLGYQVKREGAGQAVLLGLPNAGKSQLLSAITNATPEVADYPFTTQTPIPGMMRFENIQIQIVDIPPITDNEAKSWLGNLLRSADILLIIVDLGAEPLNQVETVLEELNKLKIEPMSKGVLVVGNKADMSNASENYHRLSAGYDAQFPLISISAKEGTGLDELKKGIYQALDVIRVYTKAPGRKPDFDEPVVLNQGSTVEDAAEAVHKDFRHKLKYALVWGSGKFNGQKVKREHTLEDGDVIELHI